MSNLTDDEPLRILLVDDIPHTADTLKRTLEQTLKGINVQVEDGPGCFNRALTALESPRHIEAVILDLYEGALIAENKEGGRVWQQIWERRLVPVIFYTGGSCDLDPPIPEDNPFLKCFKKTYGADEDVAKYLASIEPYILALRQVEDELNKTISIVIKDVLPIIWNSTEGEGNDTALRAELLVRSTRRRLAATMDLNTTITDNKLKHWEQYIYPALGTSLLTGDILLRVGADKSDPDAYRMILTPSCDMQLKPNGECKVSSVLVAKCQPINEYVRVVNSTFKPKSKDLSDLITRLLTEPHQSGYIPLPEYKMLVPCMAVNLRELELILVGNIDFTGANEKQYRRVVSVDSPFREQIAWAYLQVSGRPGLPDRELSKWSEEIIKASESPAAKASDTSAAGEKANTSDSTK